MDLVAGKMGSYWLGQQANSQLSSVSNDINSLSTSIEGGTKWLVNKVKGKAQKPLTELLKEHDFPVGLFPREATDYEFNEETKKLLVHIPSACEVTYRDQSVMRFATTVTGNLEKGKLSDIDGIKTKFIIWLKVSIISSEEGKLNFYVGITRSRDRSAYEFVRDGVTVDKF
ncbi:uncharacterized protein At5g01610-like [Andrographis paniculata]|uniref:uncharacterized protein At5g01610-like n=1 Tax=Andrographis paniculata TaxID=175694 RepID=UPI0021E9A41C|nr:uncharacterized protein At5g01610-like [Andrographis paniculata]